jgi:peptide deformylase
MIHPIRTYPDGVLRRVADEIRDITDEVRRLASDMAETMCAARGVGLAANQIGRPFRIVTVEAGSEKESSPLVVVNPIIVGRDGEEAAEEGCLSMGKSSPSSAADCSPAPFSMSWTILTAFSSSTI